jgi:hypothetical protein
MEKKRGDIRERESEWSRVVQLTFNWYAHDKGEMFGEFTVGYPADPYDNPRFPHRGKIVTGIEIRQTPDLFGIITFDDGSTTVQRNVNNWSTISKMPEDEE